MEIVIIGLGIAAWFMCGAFAYARIFAQFQRRYPMLAEAEYQSDRKFAMTMATFGPVALFASLLTCDEGMKWR